MVGMTLYQHLSIMIELQLINFAGMLVQHQSCDVRKMSYEVFVARSPSSGHYTMQEGREGADR